MTASVPFTWEEMRTRFEPTMPTEACEICRHIPASLKSDFPDAWKRLETVGYPDESDAFKRYRCPICRQHYHWSYTIPWNQYDPYNPDLAGEPYTSLYRIPLRLAFDGLIELRIAHERFGRALAAIAPELAPTIDTRMYLEGGISFSAHQQVIRVACGEAKRWLVLSEDGELGHCTLAEMTRIAATDPPSGLDQPVRALAYVSFIDQITSAYQYSYRVIRRFEDIPWRQDREHTDAERACVEELRRTNRIEPDKVEHLADRTVVHRWVIVDHALLRRVLTVRPTGEVQREEAVIADGMPTPPW